MTKHIYFYNDNDFPQKITETYIKQQGFKFKKDYHNWTNEQEVLLKETLINISKDATKTENYEDVFYYISHYVFHDEITKDQIASKVRYLLATIQSVNK